MKTLALWVAIEIASACHGHRRVREDHGQPGEVGGDVVEQQRVGVAQLDPASAGQPGADAVLAGVEQRRARRAPRSPPTAGANAGSSGENACRLGWNLNPRTPYSSTRRRAGSTAAAPWCGSTEPNGISTSACSAACVGDLLAGQRRVPGRRGGVDGEDDGGHAGRAVAGRRGRRRSACGSSDALEVRRRGVQQLLVQREVAVARRPRRARARRCAVTASRSMRGLVAASRRVRLSRVRDLSSLPEALCGSSATNTTDFGHLVAGQPAVEVGEQRVLVELAPGAQRRRRRGRPRPSVSSGTPITAHSATSGWVCRACSTSAG